MDKQNDLQAILNALNEYTQKYNVDVKKHKEVYNAILSLTNRRRYKQYETNTRTKKQK